jgi:hypothetical protein
VMVLMSELMATLMAATCSRPIRSYTTTTHTEQKGQYSASTTLHPCDV